MISQENHTPNRIPLEADDGQFYDVIEIDLVTGKVALMTDQPKGRRNADAVMRFAMLRRAREGTFYEIVDAGKYKDGDKYESDAQ